MQSNDANILKILSGRSEVNITLYLKALYIKSNLGDSNTSFSLKSGSSDVYYGVYNVTHQMLKSYIAILCNYKELHNLCENLKCKKSW